MNSAKNNNTIKRRLISLVTAAALITNTLPLGGISEVIGSLTAISASADDASFTPAYAQDYPKFAGNSISFGDTEEIIAYSYWYNTVPAFASFHENDALTVALSGTDNELSQNFRGIGTEAHPFRGTLSFPSEGTYTLSAHRALFGYIYDCAEIKGTKDTFTLVLSRASDVGDGVSAPVLADHVRHYTGDPENEDDNETTTAKGWKIQVTGGHTFSGAIGEMEAKALVDLTFTNSTGKEIVSNAEYDADSDTVPDVGLFCGKMDSSASLTVTYKNAISHATTSANGNAGTFVGTMGENATLNVITDLSTISSTVTANGAAENSKGYAGGLVGDMDSTAVIQLNSDSNLSSFAVEGNIVGTEGAGGLYGHYLNSYTSASFNITAYKATATATAKYCGGLFGVFENKASDSSYTVTFTGKDTTNNHKSGAANNNGYFGGLIGSYKTISLKDTLSLSELELKAEATNSFASFGGVIGIVDCAAYIKANDVTVTAAGAAKRQSADFFGGLIGTTSESKGVMVDLGDFTLTASGFNGGGVVGKFNNGVLRLSGTTDMSGAKPSGDASSSVTNGQLVGANDNVLVYALGDGTNGTAYGSGWSFKRSSGAIADDLGTWGEVVRGIDDSVNTNMIYFSSTDHTVTLAAVTADSTDGDYDYKITSAEDFVKIALNIQLNQGSDYDCLKFATGGAARSTLLSGEITLSSNISLTGTGINGLMRDGSASISESEIGGVGTFTGTFDGNDKTITFTTGEGYGLDSAGSPVTSTSEGIGQIYRHQYNGLFSVIGDGTTPGTVKDLTLAGSFNIRNSLAAGMSIGGVAARSHGSTSLSGITADQTFNYYDERTSGSEADWGKYIGGLIGYTDANTDNGTVAVSGTTVIKTTFSFGRNPNNWVMCGGAIGAVESGKIQIDFANRATAQATDALTVSATVTAANAGDKDSSSCIGGLIGYINSNGKYTDKTVNIDNTSLGVAADTENDIAAAPLTINNISTGSAGGLLGYSWLDTTVNVKGLKVANAALNYAASAVGVMCYDATGKWVVDSLEVSGLTVTGGGASLGMLVNKAYNGDDGLYLNVLNSGYTLTSSGITLPGSLAKFDELAAYSAAKAETVLTGGKGVGVVSINMNSARTGTQAKVTVTGTYQNQISRTEAEGIAAIDSTKYPNSTTRYYYNLDVMDKTDGGQNLVLWSVSKYAPTNISGEFVSATNPLGAASGNTSADLTGLSFYPLAKADGYSIGNLALTFDYNGIYTTEGTSSFNTDSYIRDPGAANQHYLMQSGLFIDSSAGKKLTVSGALSLAGNFLEVGSYKGALISGTMKGSFDSSKGSISLNGLTPRTTGGVLYSDGYLLINSIKRDDATVAIPELKLYNVSTGTGYTTTVAKSLIGSAQGPGLVMDFSNIKLDARKSADSNTALNTAYNTTSTIFKDSTLLASILTDKDAQLTYNYAHAADWGDADENGSADRNVTYGFEVSGSLEYQNQETMYYDQEYYTDPTSGTNSSSAISFAGYIPYVKTAYGTAAPSGSSYYYREIRVNVVAQGLIQGCGTYNDPYIITDGSQLESVAGLIKDGNSAPISKINLPKTALTTIAANTVGSRWCEDEAGHALFTPSANGETYTSTASNLSGTWNTQYVRWYLANAYYKISSTTIELSSDFAGLGGAKAQYAFRGVIVGSGTNNGVPTVTINNQSENPFIKVSNGSVVKDINFVVAEDNIELKQANNSNSTAFFGYDYTDSRVCKFYGGIIGEVMGGDNIIDNSYVTYGNSTITLSGNNGTIVPVGGYVGVVVFGGVIFKNMTASKTTVAYTGLKVTVDGKTTEGRNLASETYVKTEEGKEDQILKNEEAWAAIYVNPIVGRVINGYAVNETGGNAKNAAGTKVQQFSVTEDNHYHDDDKTERTGTLHTLKNGTKHYSIADIDPELDKQLEVTAVGNTTTDGTINVPNSQALFILSLITQSCAGTATTANGGYSASLSYGIYSTKEYGETSNTNHVYGMSHIADYSDVGKSGISKESNTDYALASGDTAATSAIPYIIRWYTDANASGNYPARCVTSTLGYYDINLTGKTANSTQKDDEDNVVPLASYTYQLPDSFRGLGSVGFYDYKGSNSTDKSENYYYVTNDKIGLSPYCIKVDTFEGNGCIIDEDIYLNKYRTDNYFNILHGNTDQVLRSGQVYEPNSRNHNHGIGLFDSVVMKNSSSSFKSFTISGSVNTAVYKDGYNKTSQEIVTSDDSATNSGQLLWISSGGVLGWATNGSHLKFDNIILQNLSVRGSAHVGGILGFSGLSSSNPDVYKVLVSQCSGENISVEMSVSTTKNENDSKARNAMGGLIGKVFEATVVFYGTDKGESNTDLSKYSEVKFSSFSFGNDAVSYQTSAGGLVGFAGNGCRAYDMKLSPYNNASVTIGGTKDKITYVGGIAGLMQPTAKDGKTCLAVFKNCTLENLNYQGKYVGGLYGGKWNSSGYSPYKITVSNCKVIGNSSKNSITGDTYAGGLIGWGLVQTRDNGVANIAIEDSLVSNYNIFTKSGSYSGGFVGYCNAQAQSITCYIHDSAVENCIIGSSGNDYAGGAIGGIAYSASGANSDNKILGYNIKLENVTSPSSNIGAWVGFMDNNDNKTDIQFTGMAIYGQGFDKNIGSWNIAKNQANSKTTFVFADYTGQSNGTTETSAATEGEKSGEVFSVNAASKLITRTITTVSGETKTERKITYNYTVEPTTTDLEQPAEDSWAIDETNGTITRIFENKKYVYSIAVSGLNKGDIVPMPKYPFVNINPQSDLGSREVITGDGAVLYNSSLTTANATGAGTMAAKIYADLTDTDTSNPNYTRKYTTFADTYIADGHNISYYMNRSVDDDGDRISTFATERQGITLQNGVDDFAVVVIANNSEDETTNLINRYIQLVTNTTNNYADRTNTYYKVAIKQCKYDSTDGSFEITDKAAGIVQTDDGADSKFKLNGASADSLNSNTFTLLDVQFMDPMDSTKIAYHLYVPVYTIKQMEVGFYSSAKTGARSVYYNTEEDSYDYSSLWANNSTVNHLDSLDTWMTQYFRYQYQSGDINTLLNTGKLNWGFKKSFDFMTATNSSNDDKLPADTYLVLVDPNGNKDNVYYAKAGDLTTHAVSDDSDNRQYYTVELDKFKDSSPSENSFKACTFNEMIAKDIRVTSGSNSGSYDAGTAVDHDVFVIDPETGVKSYYKFNSNGNGGFDLTVDDDYVLNEDYYLSIYVSSKAESTNKNKLYHYSVQLPSTKLSSSNIVSDPENPVPKVRSASLQKKNDCNILIADLFEQEVDERLNVTNDMQQITASNKKLTVEVSTKITTKDGAGRMFLGTMASDLYHSFNISLVRYSEGGGVDTDIIGLDNPTAITARYSINSSNKADSDTCNKIDLQGNYLNIETTKLADSKTNLLNPLSQGTPVEIYSWIEMDFDELKLNDEFPIKETSGNIGVNVAVTTNLAYESTGLAFSSISEKYDQDSHYYYIESVPSATLTYTPLSNDADLYEKIGEESKNQTTLGVNGKKALKTMMPVNTEAVYNVVSLPDAQKADIVRLTFALSKKTDTVDATTGLKKAQYDQITELGNYLGKITFESKDAKRIVQATGSSITVDLDAADCDYSGGAYNIKISFEAKTGEGFVDYANYRVDLMAELYYTEQITNEETGQGTDQVNDEENNEENNAENNETTNQVTSQENNVENSIANDYLIYTNAKINPDILKNNQASP